MKEIVIDEVKYVVNDPDGGGGVMIEVPNCLMYVTQRDGVTAWSSVLGIDEDWSIHGSLRRFFVGLADTMRGRTDEGLKS